ncbi:50S ribosomal protein L11 [Candidatus Micrarchaeota archaeon]|jgi:large subunit ribosomal protein L11|nr:50S ribosomal protein L11 [Candidatus Micrarchaeota archaeon]
MSKITINALIDGGSATAGPPLGPSLAPMGVNIGEVINKINEATKEFKGMKLPVKVIVDKNTKTFEIEVGSPPTSELIKKAAGIQKGKKDKTQEVGNITLEKVIEIARKKKTKVLGKSLKSATKEVLGSCISLGLNCNGKNPKKVTEEIDKGEHDSLFGGE